MTDEQTPAGLLEKIEAHLKSIRSMLNFFTLVLVLSIIFQVLNFLLS